MRRFPLCALLFSLGMGPAAAQSCSDPVRVTIQLPASPLVNTSESFKFITTLNLDGFLYFPMGSVTLGLYLPHTVIRVENQSQTYPLSNGQFLACIPAPLVSISMTPTIYIARELAQKAPCVARAVLQHEMGHHDLQKQISTGSELKKSIEETLLQHPLSAMAATPQEAQLNLSQALASFQQSARDPIFRIVSDLQARHDNASEYEHLAFSCNGELQELLKNEWSGYIYK